VRTVRVHNVSEQARGLALERQIADLVDDDHRTALDPAQLLVERVSLLCRLEALHLLRGGEGDPIPRLAGLEREPDYQVGLTGPGE
jgi:hypothetical protein